MGCFKESGYYIYMFCILALEFEVRFPQTSVYGIKSRDVLIIIK